jgi:hypothetical protein
MKSLPMTGTISSVEKPLRAGHGHSPESGYAYFLVLFLVVTMITASTVVMMDMRTQGRRQREEDMMWRGKEFERAIKHYYHRAGHYPQNLEDLEKGVANIHFLRPEAATDPMNKDGEGKWRFIYTNASGQIIGSVHYATMQQMALLDLNGGLVPGTGSDSTSDQDSNSPPIPQPDQGSTQALDQGPGQADGSNQGSTQGPTQNSSSTLGNCPPQGLSSNQLGLSSSQTSGLQLGSGIGGGLAGGGLGTLGGQSALQIGPSSTASIGQSQPGMGTNQSQAASTCGPGQGALGLPASALKALMDMKPSGPVDGPVIGGFLVGVGSTVDRKSVKVYKRGKKYKEWEFIWNPYEEQALAMQQGINQAGALGGLTGIGLGQPSGLGLQGAGSTGAFGTSPMQAPPTGQPSQPQ